MKRINIGILLFTAALLVNGCAAPKSTYTTYSRSNIDIPESTSIFIRLPPSEQVTFRGLPNYDSVGTASGGSLYVGDTAGLFVASLLVHALVVDSVKNSQKQKAQEEADKIILPYKPLIDDFSNDVLKYLIKDILQENELATFSFYSEDVSEKALVLDTKPIFFISENHSSVILKNIVSLWRNPTDPELLYENLVEVHSLPIENINETTDYNEVLYDDLLNQSSMLFVESLDLFTKDLYKNIWYENESEKTLRFLKSGETTFERGSLLEAECSKITIRTLRGWLKSVVIDSNDYLSYFNQDCTVDSLGDEPMKTEATNNSPSEFPS